MLPQAFRLVCYTLTVAAPLKTAGNGFHGCSARTCRVLRRDHNVHLAHNKPSLVLLHAALDIVRGEAEAQHGDVCAPFEAPPIAGGGRGVGARRLARVNGAVHDRIPTLPLALQRMRRSPQDVLLHARGRQHAERRQPHVREGRAAGTPLVCIVAQVV
eukprot:7383184-Prymnesium_polylepis.2